MSRQDEILAIFRKYEGYMNDRVSSGIENNRKSYNTLTFVDSNGEPVKNVHYSIRQKTHDFKFGCSIFLLDEMETDEKNARYKEVFADTFNLAVAPFYWADLEPVRGQPRYAADSPKVYRRPAPDLVVDYCKKHGIAIKGHCIVYDAFSPKWLPREVPAIKALYEDHMAQLSERYGRDINQWDVINETLGWNVYDHGRVTPFFREDDYVDWSFACARRHLPTQQLFINEAGGIWDKGFHFNRTPYYMQIDSLLRRGVPIDCIGIQAHSFVRREQEIEFSKYRYDPLHVFDALDLYARFGKPIQISEVTFPAYSDEPVDEDIQAEILRNMYSMWFSHPAMDGIVYWNLADGYTYNAVPGDMSAGENYYRGGLLRFDLSEKPIMKTLRSLIKETWHTALSGNTEGSNQATVKGFHGLYELVAHHDGRETVTEFHLDRRIDLDHKIVLR